MKKLLLLFFLIPVFSFAQLENSNWYFGDSAGIKFTSTGVVPILNAVMRSKEGCASISDSLGNLLFYTNSQTVWNKDNDTMENGYGIKPHFISSSDLVSDVTQGALIIPRPDNEGFYYLFSLYGKQDSTLVLSEIDMNQNGGLGKVISKNKFIYTGWLSEQMTAVKHGNGRDYWVVCHAGYSSRFVKFLITSDSVSSPIFQDIGNSLDTQYFYLAGQSIFSFLGNKYLVITSLGLIKLFDFDRCSGEFSNPVELSSSPYPTTGNRILYGASFSPDGKKIFVSDYKKLYQYDLDSTDIKSTKITIWQNTFNNYYIGQHQLGIDGKIYVVNGYYQNPSTIFSVHNKNLCVIDSPNNKGINCSLKIDAISLGGKRTFFGLSNSINYSLGRLIGNECDTLFTSEKSNVKGEKSVVRIYPNPAQDELSIEVLNGIAPKQFSIIDVTGRTVLQLTPRKPNTQINIQSLVAGVYFIKMQMSDGEMEIRKFVKE